MDAGTVVVAGLGVAGTLGGSAVSYAIARSTGREETERLRVQYGEDERRNRQGTYHRLLGVLQELSGAPDPSRADELIREWWFASAGVHLFGAREVSELVRPVADAVASLDPREDIEAWRRRVREAARPLLLAMREDVGAPG